MVCRLQHDALHFAVRVSSMPSAFAARICGCWTSSMLTLSTAPDLLNRLRNPLRKQAPNRNQGKIRYTLRQPQPFSPDNRGIGAIDCVVIVEFCVPRYRNIAGYGADSRTTSSTGNVTDGVFSPASRRKRKSTVVLAMRGISCRIVVKVGRVAEAMGESSKPTT